MGLTRAFAVGYDTHMRSKRKTPQQRLAALRRLAQRLANAGRDTATKADRQVVAREHGTTASTLGCWQSRYPDDWTAALVAAGLHEVGPDASGAESGLEMIRDHQPSPTGLTPQQEQACRWIIAGGKQNIWVAEQLGVHQGTVTHWRRLAAWTEYAQALQCEIHEAIVAYHIAAASAGGRLRVRYLAQVARVFDVVEADGNYEMTVEELAKLAPAVDRITTSAEDRAGYPKTDRIEQTVDATVAVVGVAQLATMTPDQLRALALVDEAD